ncbi:DUF1310 domain-containing protein [Listeria monocytogenes]|uniref:DUF1310 family protein n=1 Tax=Listeria monocytogenes TaxID=1639 RepID=UPI0010BBBBB7|nr:DUF1310 family protein [Listeria monocytogenes]EAC6871619.1 DUF1310 family protein [Listeria monocytogenes]EAD1931733.1 DUF1310 family protein [Listeria monocytogenes]EAF5832122.1 DUF1310 family protein [Listeria monocytogenes]EGN0215579.1 DUF1310 domain-containing protein [Listeria monocytogenes]
MKKGWIVLFGIAIMIIFGLGIKFYMDEEKLNKEMMKVIYSDEAKQVFEKRLANLDAKAFTKEGIIQSYKIDEGSIKSNPMGGIEVRLIINNNSELYASYTMSRNNGVLGGGGVIISKELAKQTEVKD